MNVNTIVFKAANTKRLVVTPDNMKTFLFTILKMNTLVFIYYIHANGHIFNFMIEDSSILNKY